MDLFYAPVLPASPASHSVPTATIQWRDHHPGSEEIDQVLQKLAWQTTLTFTREKRDTDVWFMVER